MNSKVRILVFVILCLNNYCLSQWVKVNSDIKSIPAKDQYFVSLSFISSKNGWLQGINGIYHTENSGENWERISLQATRSSAESGCDPQSIFFIDTEHGWILHDDSLYATSDGGRQWTAIHLPTSKFLRIHFQSLLHGVASMQMDSGFYFTADGGKTWNQSTITGLVDGSILITHLQFINQKIGFAAGWGPGLGIGFVLKTGDGGESWKVIRQGYEYNAVWGIDSMHIVAVGVDERDRCGIIDVTFDGGATWQYSLVEEFLYGVAFRDSANGVAVARASLLVETHDGGKTWHTIENIGHESSVSVSVTGNTLYILTIPGDIYRSDRSTQTLYSCARWGKARKEYCRYVITNHDGIERLSTANMTLAGRKTGVFHNASGLFIAENVVSQKYSQARGRSGNASCAAK